MADVENKAPAEEQIASKYIARTEEQLSKDAEDFKKNSWRGYFFTILPEEMPRAKLFGGMFCIISFSYAFLRVFKDRVVFSILDNTDSKNWLKLLTFVVTQLLVIFCQNISSKSDFNHAFKKLTLYFSGILAVNAILMWFSYYIQPGELRSDALFIAGSLSMRGLNGFYPLCLVINQWVYSAFYIFAEVVGSMMVSFCFMTYLNNNTSENQNKRFVRTLLFFSNISSLTAGITFKLWSKMYQEKPKEDSDMFYIIFPFLFVALYGVVLFMKNRLEKELLNVIVIPSGAPKKTASKKKKIGLRDSIYLMVSSKLLLSMCAVAFFYNFISNLLETSHGSGMVAAARYLNEEPSFFASGYKSMDLICNAIATCIIMISPISLLPDKIGIAAFAAVPLCVGLFSATIELLFCVCNFPATGIANMWPFGSVDPINKYPTQEALAGTTIQCLMKIAKYGFFDIVKELVAMKIDPSIRPLFKGVFDGSITKLGKSMGSFYGILMFTLTSSQDARYYFPITAFIISALCLIWVFPIRYISSSFNEAKKAGTYMDPDLPADIKI